MASVVCQGLQSCLEAHFREPLLLRHKLVSRKTQACPSPWRPDFPKKQKLEGIVEAGDGEGDGDGDERRDGESGGWSFLKSVANVPRNCRAIQRDEEVYVHPMVKRSASALSTKSLEMCTESLGSETGSEVNETVQEFPSFSKIRGTKSEHFGAKCLNHGAGSYPPPLTSFSGSELVRVSPHREGGRLVIKATKVSCSRTSFRAERSNGRLMLSLSKDPPLNCELAIVQKKEETLSREEEEE